MIPTKRFILPIFSRTYYFNKLCLHFFVMGLRIMKVCKDYVHRNGYKRLLNKIFTSFSQLFVIIFLWELLKSPSNSTEKPDSSTLHVGGRSYNFQDCFKKPSVGENLKLDTIIYRSKSASPLSGTKNYILSADVFVREVGSDTLLVYPAETVVSPGNIVVENEKYSVTVDYTEYKNEGLINGNIKDETDHKKKNGLSLLAPIIVNGQDQIETKVLENPGLSRLVLKNSPNDKQSPGEKQNAPRSDNEALDIKLVEEQMLNVRPQDQVHQQEILEIIKEKKDFRYLVKKRTTNLGNDLPKAAQFISKSDIFNKQQQSNVNTRGYEDHTHNGTMKETQLLLLPWPDVVLDESSEPLYTEGFLERVHGVKSKLYGNPAFYDKKFTRKIKKYYLLNNPHLCVGLTSVDIAFLVYTISYNKEQRQRLRDTFLNSAKFQPFNIIHIFLVGKSIDDQEQELLRLESELHGDIVQGDFDDVFENNAWKGLMGMRWILQFCRKANFVFKMNDNIFLETNKLLKGLIPASAGIIGKRAMFCAQSPSGFNNLAIPNCESFAVLMTRHLVCSVIAASNQILVPMIEDYYLYGVLPYVVGGVEMYYLNGDLGFQTNGAQAMKCLTEQQDSCPIIAANSLPDSFLNSLTKTETQTGSSDRWIKLWNLQSARNDLS